MAEKQKILVVDDEPEIREVLQMMLSSEGYEITEACNALVENREDFMEQWTEQLQSENLLEGYRAEKFIEYTDGAEPLTEMDTDFMLKTLDHIKVFEDGTLLVVFLDGTEIECKNEGE